MTLRYSPALQNFIAESGSWKDFFDNGSIEIFTGAQPATPDLAASGNQLAIITSGGGAKTNEVQATGVLTLSGTLAGSVDTLTLAGLEIMGGSTAYNASLNQTATDVATKINRNSKNRFVVASTTGASAVITLTARPGYGTLLNAAALTIASTTLTSAVTSTTFGSGTGGSVVGINAANGLKMDYNAVAGVITKDPTQTWSGTAIGAGTQTAGWFRYKGSIADANAQDSTATFLRMDGTIAVSGGDMGMTNTSVANGAVQTLSNFQFTIPAA